MREGAFINVLWAQNQKDWKPSSEQYIKGIEGKLMDTPQGWKGAAKWPMQASRRG